MAETENGKPREITRRVVLRRERVLVLPEGVRVEELVAAKDERAMMKLLGHKVGSDPYGEAWVEVGEFAGHSKTHAIEAYAGKPNTPDAKQGVYRAPSMSSWQGGLVYDAPPQPLVQRRELEG